ncbi:MULTISPECIES: hypothetical protein [Bacillaceae]|uniref:Uncharacterized protein n=1 Tax=Evansella alkalicola TaxID=745819 RepID=A0ABS6K065_9BACI|nr:MULTISPECIES: hypothetical protein [Bacillaceae]MBU9724236.1 hypothetical protein [Bacillus alkalicola]
MHKLEQKGKILTLIVIAVIALLEILSFFLQPSVGAFITTTILFVILWLMYEGHTWARIVVIVILLLNSFMTFMILMNNTVPTTIATWTIIIILLHVSLCGILMLSSAVSNFMYGQKHR